jgi:hypothetical protein
LHDDRPSPRVSSGARELGKEILRDGRNSGPSKVWDAFNAGRLNAADLQYLLAEVWSDAEWPEAALGTAAWVAMFRIAHYPTPNQPLTIYRGAIARYRTRMAWTTDIDRARWFAQRPRPSDARNAYVYSTVVEPSSVLCAIDEVCADGGRHEGEIVVDPRTLGTINRVEPATSTTRDTSRSTK